MAGPLQYALDHPGWVVFLVLLAAYLGAYFALRGRGPMRGGLEFNGPFLFWRTQLGKRAIAKVARAERLWNVVADFGIALTWLMGGAVFLLLLLSLVQYVVDTQTVVDNAPPPEFLIGLPGINPLIPVGYGIAALVVALVIHEGSHGVMAYVAKMKVKSLGLVAFIVPIGAFVEPDEEDIMRATTRQKNRLFAAGPTSNILLALVTGVILSTAFMANLEPINGGDGVVIAGVEPGSAADAAGLVPGDLLVSVAGEPTADIAAYRAAMNGTRAGQQLPLEYFRDGERHATEAVLGDYHDYYQERTGQTNESLMGRGFLGVSGISLDEGFLSIAGIKRVLQDPFDSVPAFFSYLSYPFFIFAQGVDVLAEPYSDLFVVTGPLAALPPRVFFGLATLLYWIVWINLMLGTFNALPAGPLDGGQMLRATLSERLMRRYKVDREKLEVERLEVGGLQLRGKDPETQAKLDRVNQQVGKAVRTLGFFILGLILLPVFAPPLLRLFL